MAIVTLIVISGSSVEENPGTASQGTTTARETTTGSESPKGPKVYVVQPGDTLSAISTETGVTVEELQLLNPDIDPQALASGQRLKLR